ncbi:bidirectional sugar transporter NEC1-like [Bidens hawaiensis]|uniref:bidirectional sugar transporter NEC1-like n=1 Tax=Bidens hawaiensis TaxID=980011 RepID=UPI00404A2F04
MAHFSTHLLASIFGILGNIISFCVFLAPVPTFYKIYNRKSTGGFQSVPYSVALFSCMLLLYYGNLKTENGTMIITINAIGCAIEIAYLTFFLVYATRESLKFTIKLVVLFNILSFGLIVVATWYAVEQPLKREAVVGWICAVFSVCVFAAPLSIMCHFNETTTTYSLIRTKSVEYMPFSLSFFLTLCAVMWFLYGFFIKDYYVATPNVLGFLFGVTQMILYLMYKGKNEGLGPMAQLNGQAAAATVVDLRTIMEMQEQPAVEIEVVLEMQEQSVVVGDEAS